MSRPRGLGGADLTPRSQGWAHDPDLPESTMCLESGWAVGMDLPMGASLGTFAGLVGGTEA